jgi:hypothetical protein
MKNLKPIVAILFLTTTAAILAQPATITYQPFPASQTLQSGQPQHSGCFCGIYAGAIDPIRRAITVSPSNVQTRVNQKVQIRYDASLICNGQSIADMNGVDSKKPNFGGVGTIQFESGAVMTLPNTYGIATFSGYTTAKTDSIHIIIKLQCYDTGSANCIRPCGAAIDIPVTVTQ